MPQRPKFPPTGLSRPQLEPLREQFGWNELPEPRGVSITTLFLRQFASFLVLILFAAALVSILIGDKIDTIAIFVVILLNACLGLVQELRAERAIQSLNRMLSPFARAVRDGVEQRIPARELLPGDLIVIDAGDRIPADAELLTAIQFKTDESAMSGESVPVDKHIGENADIFMGTVAVSGRGEAVVTKIGLQTEIGQIAHLTGSAERRRSPMHLQMQRLSRNVGAAAILISIIIAAIGLFSGRDTTEMVMTALSLAVAMVPEGLPAVVTITLALGAAAMARQKALARRLQAIETLGAATVICTDKTGTLTENMMTVTTVWTPSKSYEVTGTGYDPAGHIISTGSKLRAGDDEVLGAILRSAISCNHAKLLHHESGWQMIGEPTEGALVVLAYKGWADLPDASSVLSELPFSSERKCMSVLVDAETCPMLHTKGATEVVLPMSGNFLHGDGLKPLTPAVRADILAAETQMAAKGLRVLALASKQEPSGTPSEANLTFLGLVGMIDPPRPEVAGAVAMSRAAGIRTIVITGDSAVTATAIASEIGLAPSRCITGAEVEAMDETTLAEALAGDALFARTRPAHKMRIVSTLQAMGEVVAMTGDGVNDAPALKQSDIGVAMGHRGTDVAKDAADIVLVDDNYATIVRAIGEGRRQFENIRKFVRYLLSSNAGEVVALALNLLLGGPLIFLATQILWMNLVTDSATAVALGLEKAEPEQMRRPPFKPDTPVIGRAGAFLIMGFGAYTGLACLFLFLWFAADGTEVARTTAFTAMVVFEMVSVFAFRSMSETNFAIGWLSNRSLLIALVVMAVAQLSAVYLPPVQVMLHTQPLLLRHWGMIWATAVPLVVVPELLKMWRAKWLQKLKEAKA